MVRGWLGLQTSARPLPSELQGNGTLGSSTYPRRISIRWSNQPCLPRSLITPSQRNYLSAMGLFPYWRQHRIVGLDQRSGTHAHWVWLLWRHTNTDGNYSIHYGRLSIFQDKYLSIFHERYLSIFQDKHSTIHHERYYLYFKIVSRCLIIFFVLINYVFLDS